MKFILQNNELVEKLIVYLKSNDNISIAALQRCLNISVARAGIIVDELQNLGIVKYNENHSCIIIKEKILLLNK